MMGLEPIPCFSQERILSPLRLPFRHIGGIAVPCYMVFCKDTKMNSIPERIYQKY